MMSNAVLGLDSLSGKAKVSGKGVGAGGFVNLTKGV